MFCMCGLKKAITAGNSVMLRQCNPKAKSERQRHPYSRQSAGENGADRHILPQSNNLTWQWENHGHSKFSIGNIYIYCVCEPSKNYGSSIDNPMVSTTENDILMSGFLSANCWLFITILLFTETRILEVSYLYMHEGKKSPWHAVIPGTLLPNKFGNPAIILPKNSPNMHKNRKNAAGSKKPISKIYICARKYINNTILCQKKINNLHCPIWWLQRCRGFFQAFTKAPTFMKERRARKKSRIKFSLAPEGTGRPRAPSSNARGLGKVVRNGWNQWASRL